MISFPQRPVPVDRRPFSAQPWQGERPAEWLTALIGAQEDAWRGGVAGLNTTLDTLSAHLTAAGCRVIGLGVFREAHLTPCGTVVKIGQPQVNQDDWAFCAYARTATRGGVPLERLILPLTGLSPRGLAVTQPYAPVVLEDVTQRGRPRPGPYADLEAFLADCDRAWVRDAKPENIGHHQGRWTLIDTHFERREALIH